MKDKDRPNILTVIFNMIMIVGMLVSIYAVLTAIIAIKTGKFANVEIKPTIVLRADQFPNPTPSPSPNRRGIGDVGAMPEE